MLFDLGNILVRLNSVDLLWQENSNVVESDICQQRWSDCMAVYELETGKINDFYLFYEKAVQQMGLNNIDYKKFNKYFIEIIGDVFEETHHILSILKNKYRLMILSNTSEKHWLYCRDELKLGQYFEKAYLSYEMGYMKPDIKIYKSMLTDINVNPQNIYYIDDKEENIKAAKELGIKPGSIVANCSGKNKSAYGYHFEYCDNKTTAKRNVDVSGGKNPMAKKVKCIDDNRIWDSASECAIEIGVTPSMIHAVCRGVRKSAKGYRFEYIIS